MPRIYPKLWPVYRAQGMCGNCGKNEPVPGQTLCPYCKDLIRYGQKKFRSLHADEIREDRKKRYNDRKAAGLCVACGKNNPISGQVLCPECKIKQKEAHKKYRARKRKKAQEEK